MNERKNLAILRRYAWLLVLLAVVAVLVYHWRFAPVAVETHRVGRGTILAEVFGTGTLEAKTRAALGAQISGRIAEIAVDQGELVTAGQLLVKLDSDELQRQLEMAQASLDAAKAGVERLQADQQRAQAVLEQAKRDYERTKSLLESKIQPLSEAEKIAEKLAVAEADLKRTLGASAEAAAQVRAAEKTLLYQQARLNYAAITAPFAGLVVLRQRDPGDVVVPGSVILEIVSTDVLWISAWVDESQLDGLRPGQPARVVFRSNPKSEFHGSVDRLGSQVDRETREFVVDVRVRELPDNWAIGQRAEVYIETDRRKDTLILPLRFLAQREGATGVWLARAGAAHWQPVKTGLHGRDTVEITEGLAEGDAVIFIPQGAATLLREGRRVETK